jgi:alpha 1,2-mannosyltransferase
MNKFFVLSFISILVILSIYINHPKLSYRDLYSFTRIVESNSSDEKPNACIIVLLRNSDLLTFIKTITNVEKNFNNRYNYPYILFNDGDFDDNFRRTIKKYTKSSIEFVKLSKESWGVPDWIDQNKLNVSLSKFGFTVGYRHMCRFYSGLFYKHKATLKYDIYMRLDSTSDIPCQTDVDPFRVFQNNPNLMYGFTVAAKEAFWTLPTLWETIKDWLKKDDNINKIPKSESLLGYISNDNGTSLNRQCIFYNNFEVGRFSMFRSEQYNSYFDHLDKAGGFYYERWGICLIITLFIYLL